MTTLQAQPRVRLEDFQRIILAYQQATERLKDSHELLMGEVSRLRAELADKKEQLERRKRLAALGEMAAGVAHEIRNPLGSIQLYADLLLRQLAGDSDKVELAGKLSSAVRGLDAIVSDMLTFTRVIEANKQLTPFAALVADAAAEAAGQLASAGVTLSADAIDPSLQVELDSRLFKRVLVNLILNGAEAMAEEPGRRLLTVTAEEVPPGRWRIAVRDSGPGVPPEALDAQGEKLFRPFFTTKAFGTGLGLAIVHHIIEAHGGTITAGNCPDGGAQFVILLP